MLFLRDVKELSVIQNNFLLASAIEVGEDVFPWDLCTIDSAVRLKTVILRHIFTRLRKVSVFHFKRGSGKGTESGETGPWTFLYRKNDKGRYYKINRGEARMLRRDRVIVRLIYLSNAFFFFLP